MPRKTRLIMLFIAAICTGVSIKAEKTVFNHDFSPAEGFVTPQEKPLRDEICLNGSWELQRVDVPADWRPGTGVAPELTAPAADKWEKVKIKIPSPINVNDWGRGAETGAGTRNPYTPSSVYFPSYPKDWKDIRMAWLRRSFETPSGLDGHRLILHFEAIAGESVIMVNGHKVHSDFESHLPVEVDVTDYVAPQGGVNELMVGVRQPRLFDKSHPTLTKMGATYPTGSNTDGLLGIWQDVSLMIIPEISVSDVYVVPDVESDLLTFEVTLTNNSPRKRSVKIGGDIRPWINLAGDDVISAPEIAWTLGEPVMDIKDVKTKIPAGESVRVSLVCRPGKSLKLWSPDEPNLYTLELDLKDGRKTADRKSTRFGWRQFTIVGDEFRLNGKKIQCFGDIQHPFSAYVCSRRFAWAWLKMIKDFGGNAVRPHAQPWPRAYYDLADEMGLMVLDETALFGSSIRLNLEESVTWARSRRHLARLIHRDRNHPSVIGWSAGNEMFAIALLNKPDSATDARWNDSLVTLARSAAEHDRTRPFITLDGDRDMDGRLPVWSKHFGHGLRVEDLPRGLNKPLIVGESGATYYGRPSQLTQFAGDDAYRTYRGRSRALAADLYQNVTQMALPYLAYYSPSEISWFGIEHLNLGYHDFSRLPDQNDGIWAGKPYEEGRFGYQYERIPPYVTTFNPGLDPALPLYRPLPLFHALKAALSGGVWEQPADRDAREPKTMPAARYDKVCAVGKLSDSLSAFLRRAGVSITDKPDRTTMFVIDMSTADDDALRALDRHIGKSKNKVSAIAFGRDKASVSPAFTSWTGDSLKFNDRSATAMEPAAGSALGNYLRLGELYFAENDGGRNIVKTCMEGPLAVRGRDALTASSIDWSLFNNTAEHHKCAQVVLYESLHKPSGLCWMQTTLGDKTALTLSTVDYTISTDAAAAMWRKLFGSIGLATGRSSAQGDGQTKRAHDLLLDGPVD